MDATNSGPDTTDNVQSSVQVCEAIDPPLLGKPHALYSAITKVRLSKTASQYYISGQVAIDPRTNDTPNALSPQIDLCLERLSLCLDHTGAQIIDIVKLMYYVKDSALSGHDETDGPGAGMSTIRDRLTLWLGGHRPSSCLNRVAGLSEEKYYFEVEAVVVLSHRGGC